jgi:hypothetical protein
LRIHVGGFSFEGIWNPGGFDAEAAFRRLNERPLITKLVDIGLTKF